jgi:hypothetical protein
MRFAFLTIIVACVVVAGDKINGRLASMTPAAAATAAR